jgi:hypothetical protein
MPSTAAVLAMVTKKAPGTIQDVLDEVLQDSNSMCPVDTGKLRDSGRVETDGSTGSITYDADYAIYVHEDMSKRHPDGQAKFLETAIGKHKKILNSLADGMQLD